MSLKGTVKIHRNVTYFLNTDRVKTAFVPIKKFFSLMHYNADILDIFEEYDIHPTVFFDISSGVQEEILCCDLSRLKNTLHIIKTVYSNCNKVSRGPCHDFRINQISDYIDVLSEIVVIVNNLNNGVEENKPEGYFRYN